MLARKLLIDFTFNWIKAIKSSPWLLLTLFLISIPTAALFNFYLVKDVMLSHSIISNDFKGHIAHVAIKGEGDKYSAIEPFLADSIKENLQYPVIYETTGQLSLGLRLDKQEQVNVSFISSEFLLLKWRPHIGSFDKLFSGGQAGGNFVAVSYQYWVDELGKKADVIGSFLFIDDKAVEVVAVLPQSLDRFRKFRRVDLLIPYESASSMVGIDTSTIGPDVFTYIVSTKKIEDKEKIRIEKFLADEAYLFDEDELKIVNAIGMNISEYLAISYRVNALSLLFFILLIFCLIAFVATYSASYNARLEEREVRLLFGASNKSLWLQMLWESLLTAFLSGCLILTFVFSLGNYISFIFGEPRFNFYNSIGTSLIVFAISYVLLFFTALVIISTVQQVWGKAHIGRGASASLRTKFQGYFLMVIMSVVSAFSLFISTLLYHSIVEVKNVNIGFEPHQRYLVTSPIPTASEREAKYFTTQNNELLLQQSEALLGESALTSSMSPPMSKRTSHSLWLTPTKQSIGNGPNTLIESDMVWPNYFQVMNTPIILGRAFSWKGKSEIVVSESLWKTFFHNETLASAYLLRPSSDGLQEYKIIGVVADIYADGADQTPAFKVYSLLNFNTGFESYVVNSNLNEVQIKLLLEQLFTSMGEQQKKLEVSSISDLIEERQQPMNAQFYISNLVTIIVVIACLVFSFSVIAQIFASDAREIALRFSLGAPSYKILLSELKVLIAIALPLYAFATFVISKHKSEISLLLHSTIGFNEQIFILNLIIFSILITFFIFGQIVKTKKKAWLYLT